MKNVFALFLFVVVAGAQPLPPKTTTYTRQFLTNDNIQGSLSSLGFVTTNTTTLTNASFFTSQFDVQTGLLHIKNGAGLTNAAMSGVTTAVGLDVTSNANFRVLVVVSNINFTGAARSNIVIGAGNDMSIATNGIMIGEGGSAIAGSGIHIGNGGGTENEGIALGNGSAAATDAIAIGDQCDAQAVYSIAIGKGIELQPGDFRTIIIAPVGGDFAGRSNVISLGGIAATRDNQTIIGGANPTTRWTTLVGLIEGNGGAITNLSWNNITNPPSITGGGGGVPTLNGNSTNQTLYAADNTASILVDGRALTDGVQPSVEYGNRVLDDSTGASSLDWGSKSLLGNWVAAGITMSGGLTNGVSIRGNGLNLTNFAVAAFTYSEPFPAGGVGISIVSNVWTAVPITQTNLDTASAFVVTATNTLVVQAAGAGIWGVRGNMQIFQTSTCVCRFQRLNNTPTTLILGETAYNDNATSVVTGRVGLDGFCRFAAGDVVAFQANAEATPNQMGTAALNTGVRQVFATLMLEKK